MRDTARVIKIESENSDSKTVLKVWVIPLLTDTCINCNESACAKRGKPFAVLNTKKLPVSVGCIVKVAASTGQQTLQALAAIGLPVTAGAAGFFLPFAFISQPSEVLQVCSVLAAFLLTALGVLTVNRCTFANKAAEIIEIVDISAAESAMR